MELERLKRQLELTNEWHRRAQRADHWRAMYERQAAHAKRVEQERAELRRQLDAADQPTVEKLRERMAELIADRDAARRERDEVLAVWHEWAVDLLGTEELDEDLRSDLSDLISDLFAAQDEGIPVVVLLRRERDDAVREAAALRAAGGKP